MHRNETITTSSCAWIRRLAAGLLLAACTARVPAEDEPPSCEEIAFAMVDECADELETYFTCYDAAAEFGEEACAHEGLEAGRCTSAVASEVTGERRLAALSRFACEVDEDRRDDCDARIEACM